jgi:hypothetical protein
MRLLLIGKPTLGKAIAADMGVADEEDHVVSA